MGPYALAVTVGLYLLAAVDFGRAGRWGLSLAFVAYACANIGFILEALLK